MSGSKRPRQRETPKLSYLETVDVLQGFYFRLGDELQTSPRLYLFITLL